MTSITNAPISKLYARKICSKALNFRLSVAVSAIYLFGNKRILSQNHGLARSLISNSAIELFHIFHEVVSGQIDPGGILRHLTFIPAAYGLHEA